MTFAQWVFVSVGVWFLLLIVGGSILIWADEVEDLQHTRIFAVGGWLFGIAMGALAAAVVVGAITGAVAFFNLLGSIH